MISLTKESILLSDLLVDASDADEKTEFLKRSETQLEKLEQLIGIFVFKISVMKSTLTFQSGAFLNRLVHTQISGCI